VVSVALNAHTRARGRVKANAGACTRAYTRVSSAHDRRIVRRRSVWPCRSLNANATGTSIHGKSKTMRICRSSWIHISDFENRGFNATTI